MLYKMVTKEYLEELYWKKQLSFREIAKRLGFKSNASVRYWFKKFGIKTRNHKEASLGIMNGMYNKKHSKKSKIKMSNFHKIHPTKYWLGKKGEAHPNWKGGFYSVRHKEGYIFERYSSKDGLKKIGILRSNRIWIQHNQMPIPQGYIIHHRNGIKDDDRIENLCLLPHSYHTSLHNQRRNL